MNKSAPQLLLLSLLITPSLFSVKPAHAECPYFVGSPRISFVGCTLAANGAAIGRNYSINVSLTCYNNCGAALPGGPFVRAFNVRTGASMAVWQGGCAVYPREGTRACGEEFVSGFTLFDRDFMPGDVVRFDMMIHPNSSDAPYPCAENVVSFYYPTAPAPEISEQPLSQTVSVGSAAIFRVSAAPGDMAYQWHKSGVVLPNATSSVLVIGSVEPADAGFYAVTVRNGCGVAVSGSAELSVVATGPSVTALPASQTICLGEPAAFSINATSEHPLTYQWLRDGVPIPNAITPGLILSNATVALAGRYRVAVQGGGVSFITSDAQLTVLEPPQITIQPRSVAGCENRLITLGVTGIGSPPLQFQWRRQGVPILGANGAVLSGLPTNIVPGTYDVIVANSCGTVTSAVAIVSALANYLRPDGQVSIEWGDPLDVLQSSTNLLTWSDVASAASPYVINAQQKARFYRLKCRDRAPTILLQPDSALVDANGRVVLFVSADGPQPLLYQWFHGTNLIVGATNRMLVLPNVSHAQVGVYELRVSSPYGVTFSAPALVAIRDDRDGQAFNTTLAPPPVEILVLSSANTGGLPLNTRFALPPVEILVMSTKNTGGLPMNTTIAQPPVRLERVTP